MMAGEEEKCFNWLQVSCDFSRVAAFNVISTMFLVNVLLNHSKKSLKTNLKRQHETFRNRTTFRSLLLLAVIVRNHVKAKSMTVQQTPSERIDHYQQLIQHCLARDFSDDKNDFKLFLERKSFHASIINQNLGCFTLMFHLSYAAVFEVVGNVKENEIKVVH